MKKSMLMITVIMCLMLPARAQTSHIIGDVNDDGNITIVDALMVAQYSVGLCSCAPDDVTGDGIINIIDALVTAQYYVGILDDLPVNQTVTGLEIVSSDLERDTSPRAAPGELEALVAGNNEFAFNLYGQLKQAPGNLMFSPVSISFAFAMCYAGANGSSETQIAETLHFTLPEPRLHNAFNILDLTLTSEPADPTPRTGEELKLHLVNNAWGQKNYEFMPDFLDTLALYYGAGLYTLDFAGEPDKSRIVINDWVSDVTEQRINDLLPTGTINPLTRLVLTNAIYFKAVWLDPFNAANTADGLFRLDDGSTVTTPLMHHETLSYYTESPGEYQALELRYEGAKKNAMVIILPEEGEFDSFENSLTADKFNQIYESLTYHDVTLTMPKFSYEWDNSLKAPLMALGMTDPFVGGLADLSGINGNFDFVIQDVIHKSFITVDELGTEAAAATAIIVGYTSIPPAATMILDRPFIYAIYNRDTGSVLFLGRVMTP